MASKRPTKGVAIAAGSAILLFVLMFFDWFKVKAINTSDLLFAVSSSEPAKNAWEALDFVPIIFVLVLTVGVTLGAAALRFGGLANGTLALADGMVGMLGAASALLILFRIINPPIFRVESLITDEGALQLPIVVAFVAAGGIAVGGFLSTWEGRRAGPSIQRRIRRPDEVADGEPGGRQTAS